MTTKLMAFRQTDTVLAEQLDGDLDGVATVLHDRMVPLSKGTIDHLVVAPTGIWIIGANDDAGKVELRDVGDGRERDSQLYLGARDQAALLSGMGWQAEAVQLAIAPIGLSATPVHRCLCFTNADWGPLADPFVIDNVWVGWTKVLAEAIRTAPVLDAVAVTTLAHHLSAWFPASH